MALACAAAGCTLGPDYARPSIETPDSYRFSDMAADSRAAPQLAEVSAWLTSRLDSEVAANAR